jgi:type IV secretion system protein VirD4
MTSTPAARGRHRPGPDSDPFRAAAVGVAASLGVVAATVWAAGQVAGRLASGHWPPVAPTEALGILIRLRGTLTEPAHAWPTDAQPLLPDTTGLYATFAGLVALTAVAAYSAATLRPRRRPRDGPQPAQWANRRQLAALLVDKPTTPGRLTLGTAHRKLVAAEPGQSVAVIGPTRSGKTTGLAVPAILEWQGPVIATSVKTDLVRDTIDHRETQGEVWVYDPTASTGLPGATWTPLSACDTWQGAQRVASWMASTVKDAGGGLTDGDFWYASAAKLLAPLLFAAAHDGYTMADVVRWVDTQEEDEPCDALEHAGVREALNAARASWQREAKQKSSVYTTAETVLAAYADPSVAASARSSQIDLGRLLDGGSHTLYVCAPSDEQARLRPLFASLLHSILSVAYKEAHTTGSPLDPSLLIVLDEAANIAPLRDLDTLASTAAGQGIQLVTVWQDLAQMKVRYGDRAHTVLNNHRATLVLAGVKDPATLDHTSRLIGESEVTRHSRTVDGQGRRSNTEGTDYRRLAPDHVIRAIPQGEALLVYGSLPPARMQLRPRVAERRTAGT